MDKNIKQKRHRRIRAVVRGSADRPRASVFRAANTIAVQLIDDDSGRTLVSASSAGLAGTKKEQAEVVGERLAKDASKKGITSVVFDRGGYRYHGRVKALADAMRSAGLEF